jgi:hypothetical protein
MEAQTGQVGCSPENGNPSASGSSHRGPSFSLWRDLTRRAASSATGWHSVPTLRSFKQVRPEKAGSMLGLPQATGDACQFGEPRKSGQEGACRTEQASCSPGASSTAKEVWQVGEGHENWASSRVPVSVSPSRTRDTRQSANESNELAAGTPIVASNDQGSWVSGCHAFLARGAVCQATRLSYFGNVSASHVEGHGV